ncbi:uncharacterized protein LOC127240034 isoform X2 [Andrographis paniculata]|uniref:uncharacterized protein LOC127240034 isoform X2 n=1 Tax=Andrographis paniculata TaxID=175694 RepID=UPI0021E9A282|nr:uncharacterized protein LOC127240034 isoform X2 [Andrographis paniculata]
MEFFNGAKAVRLKSHIGKFLVADDDELTVRQSRRSASSTKARWLVELVAGNPHAVRLKSCHGRYLTAADDPFLLGMTGKKVLQTIPVSGAGAAVEWEPIKEGYKVKLRTRGGKFLRANGATPPWRNSITHDLPHRTATQDWVLWEIDSIDLSVFENQYLPGNLSRFSSSSPEELSDSPSLVEFRPSISSVRSSHNNSRRPEGMEFFSRAKAVRLQSYQGKYLIAGEDEEAVHQSRDGASKNARWTVEHVEGKSDRIRLKSCYGLYLTAADEPYLLGMTGKKVRQTLTEKKTDVSVEWEPVKEGFHVKLMTNDGKFLRGNGGPPPWRNSVTHDVPHRTATQDWVLWGVDVVDIVVSDSDTDPDTITDSGYFSPESSVSSAADDCSGSPEIRSAFAARPPAKLGNSSMNKVSAMKMFKNAESIRLKSYHNKYLSAHTDKTSIVQDRMSNEESTKWTVELVEGVENIVRLKSCHGKYLTATDEEFMKLGRKVIQSLPQRLDSSVEWEPLRDGMMVKLKTRYGNYLRANGGLTPWKSSITHDIPNVHHEWVLWEVEVVEPRQKNTINNDKPEDSFHFPNHVSNRSNEDSPRKSEGRLIYYHVADEDHQVHDEYEGHSFQFKGDGVEELTRKLEEETGLENIIVCSRNKVTGKLYPLRLSLPPNRATMNVVVVTPTSRDS